MKTAPSEELQGVAEEIVEVNVDGKEVIGSPKTPNKDAITIVKVVAEEDVTNPRRKICSLSSSW